MHDHQTPPEPGYEDPLKTKLDTCAAVLENIADEIERRGVTALMDRALVRQIGSAHGHLVDALRELEARISRLEAREAVTIGAGSSGTTPAA